MNVNDAQELLNRYDEGVKSGRHDVPALCLANALRALLVAYAEEHAAVLEARTERDVTALKQRHDVANALQGSVCWEEVADELKAENDTLRRQLKLLLSDLESSQADVKHYREANQHNIDTTLRTFPAMAANATGVVR